MRVSCLFQAEVGSNMQLLRKPLSISTCNSCPSSALRPSLHALSQPCRLDLPTRLLSLYSPRSCANQLLHQPTFTPTSFCTNTLLDQATLGETNFCTNQQAVFTQTSFYTHHLLRQPALTQTSFYPNQLVHKPTFRETSFYSNHLSHGPAFMLLRPSSYTHHFSTNQPFTPTSFTPSLLSGPGGQRPDGRRNAVYIYIYMYVYINIIYIYVYIYIYYIYNYTILGYNCICITLRRQEEKEKMRWCSLMFISLMTIEMVSLDFRDPNHDGPRLWPCMLHLVFLVFEAQRVVGWF